MKTLFNIHLNAKVSIPLVLWVKHKLYLCLQNMTSCFFMLSNWMPFITWHYSNQVSVIFISKFKGLYPQWHALIYFYVPLFRSYLCQEEFSQALKFSSSQESERKNKQTIKQKRPKTENTNFYRAGELCKKSQSVEWHRY